MLRTYRLFTQTFCTENNVLNYPDLTYLLLLEIESGRFTRIMINQLKTGKKHKKDYVNFAA